MTYFAVLTDNMNIFVSGYMKFFACIAHYYPKNIFEKYPVLLDLLFDSFDSGDQNILPVSLDTLGFIGSTIEGKLCLVAIGKVVFIVEAIIYHVCKSIFLFI